LNINFTPRALADLQEINAYIAASNEVAAQRVLSRIQQVILMFERFPLIGREGKIVNTREFSIPGLPYIIIYKIASATELDILTIVHESRQYP
jgi:toxin ParE1/3/4